MTDPQTGRHPAKPPAQHVENSDDIGEDARNQPEALDLGSIARVFQKWPGPGLMAAGTILAFAATGIRGWGVEFSDREFAGVEFAAVFLGGMVLIGLGVVVLLVRDRLRAGDEERLLNQRHEYRLEAARAAAVAAGVRGDQVARAAETAEDTFARVYYQH